MNRLQKKCFIVSAGLHLLLALVLLIGPALLAAKSRSDELPILDFVPSKLVDAAVMGGGNRHAAPPPAAAPAPPPPRVEPAKAREPAPPKETVREVKNTQPDPDSLEPAKENKPRKPEISTRIVRRSTAKPTAKPVAAATDDAAERQAADARRRAADSLRQAANAIRDGTSSATTIEEYGPGGGGPAYASYAAWVKTVYENAWVAPEDTASDNAVARVTVTIANDGNVISARISNASGDVPVDRSVQRTLDRVRFIAPFPEGSKDKQRTYIINFNLKAKRGLA